MLNEIFASQLVVSLAKQFQFDNFDSKMDTFCKEQISLLTQNGYAGQPSTYWHKRLAISIPNLPKEYWQAHSDKLDFYFQMAGALERDPAILRGIEAAAAKLKLN